MKRRLIVLAIIAAASTSTLSESLPDMAQFAQSICGDIPEGSLTRTSIQGKIEANANLLAKIITGDANVSGSRTNEIYKGIPFDKLPDKIPTISMCKIELVKLLLSQKKIATYIIAATWLGLKRHRPCTQASLLQAV